MRFVDDTRLVFNACVALLILNGTLEEACRCHRHARTAQCKDVLRQSFTHISGAFLTTYITTSVTTVTDRHARQGQLSASRSQAIIHTHLWSIADNVHHYISDNCDRQTCQARTVQCIAFSDDHSHTSVEHF